MIVGRIVVLFVWRLCKLPLPSLTNLTDWQSCDIEPVKEQAPWLWHHWVGQTLEYFFVTDDGNAYFNKFVAWEFPIFLHFSFCNLWGAVALSPPPPDATPTHRIRMSPVLVAQTTTHYEKVNSNEVSFPHFIFKDEAHCFLCSCQHVCILQIFILSIRNQHDNGMHHWKSTQDRLEWTLKSCTCCGLVNYW